MSSYPAPDLLVSYLATAAYESRQGIDLTSRSLWAIQSAKEQLVWQHDAQVSAREDGARGAAALVAAAAGRSQRLAELILGSEADRARPGEGDCTEQLAAIIADLDTLTMGGPDTAEAARRLGEQFEMAAEELLAPSSDYYTADDYKVALSA